MDAPNRPQAPTDISRELHALAFNSGSSSLKFGLYRVRGTQVLRLVSGEAEGLGQQRGAFHAQDENGTLLLSESAAPASQAEAIGRIVDLLATSHAPSPQVIGHRLVNGGTAHRDHCRVDDSVLRELEAAIAFAPLHMPAALSLIRCAKASFPGLPQMACFDTTFHQTLPDVARILPLPREMIALGIQRYGFHGLSCESIVRQLAAERSDGVPHRLAIAHLGNGASITAVRDGISVDTSMGLTPSGGVIMGTRSGDLDPGVLVYLARERQFDAAMLEDLVDHRSGLLGISGLSGDMRTLHEAAASNAAARLAIDMFCQSVRKQLGAMSVVLDGLDLIVFTGGIGENDVAVRSNICRGLSSIGVHWGDDSAPPSDRPGARCQVRVLPSQEDEQIALHATSLCRDIGHV
ncbi:acetate/propionate family kinase [Variovorax sp. H27-G14]|uniref:acetate/propionate family kinase n=1 Tax=Variovorax sp. H27-G14 TaxID=3111914 RepID=UPI0038FCD1AE